MRLANHSHTHSVVESSEGLGEGRDSNNKNLLEEWVLMLAKDWKCMKKIKNNIGMQSMYE